LERNLDEAQGAQPPFGELARALDLGVAYQVQVPSDGRGRRFTYVSDNCEALTGVSAEAAMADAARLYDQILPEHRDAFDRAETAALAGSGRFEIEVEMRRADGEVRWWRVASSGRVQADGSRLWDGLLTDITEAKRTAAELEAQRSRLEIAVEATSLGFWEWTPSTNVLNWSERNKAIFGFGPQAQVTIPDYMATIHRDDVDRCRATFLEAREHPGGGDFEMQYRAVMPNGQLRWILTRGRVLTDEAGIQRVVGTTLDNTDRHEAEERRSLVIGELAHRAKNGLQVMMAIVSETARSAGSVEDFEKTLVARLDSMAQAQDLVTAAGGRPIQLSDLVERALTPFGLDRFEMTAEVGGLSVRGDVTAGLALLLHEMATNAVKYGALSKPGGRVALRAEGAGPGMAALEWRERGGPPVESSSRRGFGSRLLQAALRQEGGKVEPDFRPDGFRARMEFRVAG
jgi:PAS domain S-box-containing protein